VIDQGRFGGLDLGFCETVEDTVNQVVVSRRAFRVNHLLALVIERDQIGEGAADVDGDGVAHLKKTPVQMFNGSSDQ